MQQKNKSRKKIDRIFKNKSGILNKPELKTVPIERDIRLKSLNPLSAYNSDNYTIKTKTGKYATDLYKPFKARQIYIGWNTDYFINELANIYKLSYSEVARLLLLDNTFSVKIGNKRFKNIYNTWLNLSKTEYIKELDLKGAGSEWG